MKNRALKIRITRRASELLDEKFSETGHIYGVCGLIATSAIELSSNGEKLAKIMFKDMRMIAREEMSEHLNVHNEHLHPSSWWFDYSDIFIRESFFDRLEKFYTNA